MVELQDVGVDLKAAREAPANRSSSSFMPKPKVPMHLAFNDVCCYVPAMFQIPGFVSTVKKVAKACASRVSGKREWPGEADPAQHHGRGEPGRGCCHHGPQRVG